MIWVELLNVALWLVLAGLVVFFRYEPPRWVIVMAFLFLALDSCTDAAGRL